MTAIEESATAVGDRAAHRTHRGAGLRYARAAAAATAALERRAVTAAEVGRRAAATVERETTAIADWTARRVLGLARDEAARRGIDRRVGGRARCRDRKVIVVTAPQHQHHRNEAQLHIFDGTRSA